MGKRRRDERNKTEGEFDIKFKQMKSLHLESNKKKLIVVLSGAQLETVKVS